MVAGASLRGMLGNRMQAEFAATEDVTRAVAITGVWVPTAALLNYCGACGYVSDVSQPEKKQDSQQESDLTVRSSFSGCTRGTN